MVAHSDVSLGYSRRKPRSAICDLSSSRNGVVYNLPNGRPMLPRPLYFAAQDLKDEKTGNYSACLPSLDAAFTIGNRVISELLNHWDVYSAQVPQ
jgi:hypothetical protein